MASAAERLAANLNLGVLAKATELKKHVWFTPGALIVYRFGTYLPVPGVDAAVTGEILAQHGGGILSMFDMFTGGALGRKTVFALDIMPYCSTDSSDPSGAHAQARGRPEPTPFGGIGAASAARGRRQCS